MGIEGMLTVGAQRADALLAGEKAQPALGEVKEGADSGVGLAVVIAEGTLVVALQLSDTVIDAESPVVREGLADFELDRFVFTLGVLIGVGLAVGVELSAEGCAGVWIRDR